MDKGSNKKFVKNQEDNHSESNLIIKVKELQLQRRMMMEKIENKES